MRRIVRPFAFLPLAGVLLLAGCSYLGALSSLFGSKSAIEIERGAIVACAGAGAASSIAVTGNIAGIIPGGTIVRLDPSWQKVMLACNRSSLAGGLSDQTKAAIAEIQGAKVEVLARMPPRGIGGFAETLAEFILNRTPTRESINAARFAMQAELARDDKRWKDRIAKIRGQ